MDLKEREDYVRSIYELRGKIYTIERQAISVMQEALEHRFLIAAGRLPQEDYHCVVPALEWSSLYLDPDTGTASGDAIQYEKVEILQVCQIPANHPIIAEIRAAQEVTPRLPRISIDKRLTEKRGPGRPSLKEEVLKTFEFRKRSGNTAPSLAREAKEIREHMLNLIGDAPQEKTIENHIRELYPSVFPQEK